MKKKKVITNFIKSTFVGVGGIVPGLSGSVLLVIFGLYEKTIEAIGSFFKDIKKNILFLIPIFLGMGVGILIFSKLIDYMLENFEMYTRFLFFGLIIGTVPLFNREVRKKGFEKKHYILIITSFLIGITLFYLNGNSFPKVETPSFLQSFILGIIYATSMIMPGVDSAAILSAIGMYETLVISISNMNMTVLIPAGLGLGLGVLVISYLMNKLIKNFYTPTFAIIFGLFISIIPKVLNESCILGFNIQSVVSILLLIIGVGTSYYMGNLNKET